MSLLERLRSPRARSTPTASPHLVGLNVHDLTALLNSYAVSIQAPRVRALHSRGIRIDAALRAGRVHFTQADLGTWHPADQLLTRRRGHCVDIATAVAAELLIDGRNVVVALQPLSATLAHAVVQLRDVDPWRVIDPSTWTPS